MTVTLTEHIGEIYITFEGETAAEVVELYRGYRDVEREAVTPVAPVPDGWVDWDGSADKPVAPFAFVEYRMRNGQVASGWVDNLNWSHDALYATYDFQIVAYRAVRP